MWKTFHDLILPRDSILYLENIVGWFLISWSFILDPASSQLGFGVLELSQSQDVEEHIVPYEADKEHLQLITTNSGYNRLSDVAADAGMKCFSHFWSYDVFFSDWSYLSLDKFYNYPKYI